MPIKQYFSECKEEVDPEWIEAKGKAMNVQRKGEAVWFKVRGSSGLKYLPVAIGLKE